MHTSCLKYCPKMKFTINDFFSKCDQIRSKLLMVKKPLMENFIFCAVKYTYWMEYQIRDFEVSYSQENGKPKFP